jgi:uncharacterized membrane protein
MRDPAFFVKPMTSLEQSGQARQVFLDVVLHPYRSLPPRGFAIIMAILCGASVIAGIFWVSRGAWPVIGFFGLDVALLYLAFRASYRSARQCERVRLTEQDLTVERISVRGERRGWRFEPAWLRVVLEETDEDRNALHLTSHGRTLTVGSFLGPNERRSFADVLKDALMRWRAFKRGD